VHRVMPSAKPNSLECGVGIPPRHFGAVTLPGKIALEDPAPRLRKPFGANLY
jgi:hypothetical protein